MTQRIDLMTGHWQWYRHAAVSPLTRRLISVNLIALGALICGVLWAYDASDQLGVQGPERLLSEAQLITEEIETRLTAAPAAVSPQKFRLDAPAGLHDLKLRKGLAIGLFAPDLTWLYDRGVSLTDVLPSDPLSTAVPAGKPTALLSFFAYVSELFSGALPRSRPALRTLKDHIIPAVEASNDGAPVHHGQFNSDLGPVALVSTAIVHRGSVVGLLAVTETVPDGARHHARTLVRLLLVFAVAIPVIFGLSIYFASTISTPIANLAEAMELGGEPTQGNLSHPRMPIPDLSGRPDEIGRLSNALCEMIKALHDRIDTNERFAADVAHEIKNPLASLRAAVGAMAIAKSKAQR